MEPAFRFGVLASGGGSNLQSLIDAYNAGRLASKPVLVISNNSKAFALERARQHGAESVVLAGYMKKLGAAVLSRYRNRMFNIHPAILPDFGGAGMYGMHVGRAVIESGATISRPTVHLVSEGYDERPILAQRQVAVLRDDTPEILQQRVLEANTRFIQRPWTPLPEGSLRSTMCRRTSLHQKRMAKEPIRLSI